MQLGILHYVAWSIRLLVPGVGLAALPSATLSGSAPGGAAPATVHWTVAPSRVRVHARTTVRPHYVAWSIRLLVPGVGLAALPSATLSGSAPGGAAPATVHWTVAPSRVRVHARTTVRPHYVAWSIRLLVPGVGLEPTPLSREVFETSASANSAIRAQATH